jgi:hypothetical protein
VVTAAEPAAHASDSPIPAAEPSAAPAAFTVWVLIARIALVAVSCLLMVVLPYLFTAEETNIVSYAAPKETPRQLPAATPSPAGTPGRLWGAIVPMETELWFFKATGPIEEMTKVEPELRTFLESVRFDKGEPKWELPDGWEQSPGFDFIFANIRIPAGKEPIELSVSRLVRRDMPLEEDLLENVNRWRGQITKPPVSAEDLSKSTETLNVSGFETTLVSLEGMLKPRGMGRGPFMGKN